MRQKYIIGDINLLAYTMPGSLEGSTKASRGASRSRRKVYLYSKFSGRNLSRYINNKVIWFIVILDRYNNLNKLITK
jgi:hypothetical protein